MSQVSILYQLPLTIRRRANDYEPSHGLVRVNSNTLEQGTRLLLIKSFP